MIKQLLATSLFVITSGVYAQHIDWEKSFGGKHSEYLFDAQPTADYGFILAGSSLSKKSGNKTEDNAGNLDYWVWKMDEGGDMDWQKSFGGSGIDMLYSVRNTRDGGFILGGTSNSEKSLQKKDSCRGKDDFWIIKLNAKGQEEWQKTIGGAGQEQLKVIVPTTDGGYLVGGSSASEVSELVKQGKPDPYGKWEKNRGNMDLWIIKLDAEGNVKWQKTLGGRYADVLESMEQTTDGGFIVGAYTNSPASHDKPEGGYGAGDYWLLKLDKDGNTQWQKVFGGEADDHLYVVKQLKDKGYLLGGSSASGTSGNKQKTNRKGTDIWLIRLDEAGDELWQETYNTGEADMLLSLHENNDGSLLLGGYTHSEVTAKAKSDRQDINDYIAIKTDAKGEEKWRRSIGSDGDDILRKMIETRDGGYIMAGTSNGKISRNRNSGKGGNDFWVVKLKDNDKKKDGEKRTMLEAMPNPVQQYTNVIVGYEFTSGTASVYDLSGRQLQSFPVTDRTIPVDLGPYPEGMYIIEVKTNAGTDSVKVLKAKK